MNNNDNSNLETLVVELTKLAKAKGATPDEFATAFLAAGVEVRTGEIADPIKVAWEDYCQTNHITLTDYQKTFASALLLQLSDGKQRQFLTGFGTGKNFVFNHFIRFVEKISQQGSWRLK